jgi:hypothetical protein
MYGIWPRFSPQNLKHALNGENVLPKGRCRRETAYLGLRAELNGAIVEGGIYFGNQRAYAFRRKIVHMVGVVDRKCL